MSEKIKILIIDDHPATGFGTQVILEQSERFEVVGLATTPNQGIEMFEEFGPSVVILDFNLPGMNGDEITERLREIDPEVLVAIYTGRDVDITFLKQIFHAGAKGILEKGASTENLFRTIECMLDGEVIMPYRFLEALFRNVEEPAHSHLTNRERTLIRYLIDGKTNTEIAEALHLSPKTIENALTELYKKLGVKGRSAVTERFLELD